MSIKDALLKNDIKNLEAITELLLSKLKSAYESQLNNIDIEDINYIIDRLYKSKIEHTSAPIPPTGFGFIPQQSPSRSPYAFPN